MPILASFDEFFHSYAEFVNHLGGRSLVVLAIATILSGISFALFIPIPLVSNHLYVIVSAAMLYLACLSIYVFRFRQVEPPGPAPQPQVAFPHLHTFSRGVFPVMALAFFTFVDDPLKSIPSLYVPAICFSSYLHLLVVLLVLRRREDFGLSDGCLAAAYGVLNSMTKSNFIRFILIVAAIILTGLRNLQFQTTPILPPIIPPLENIEIDTQKTKKQKKNHSQIQVFEGKAPHQRRRSS